MIEVDQSNHKYLCVTIDGSGELPDGHRTTISLQHEQGIELHRQLTEYYGRIEGAKIVEKRKGLIAKLLRI